LNKRRILALVLTFSFLIALLIPTTVIADTSYHVYEGQSIQEAVNAASNGDTIIVHAGTYNEMVVIETDNLTLKSDGAILDGSTFPPDRTKAMIKISNNVQGITIKGFTIQGFALSAFRLEDSSSDNTIKNNNISNGRSGFGLFSSHNNNIQGNAVSGTSLSCVYLTGDASGNLIKGNVFIGGNNSIRINGAQNNKILSNEISNGGTGISNEISSGNIINDNKISYCGTGISVMGSENNIIKKNEVSFSTGYGIYLFGVFDPLGYPDGLYISANNLIKENHVFNSGNFDLYWDGGGPGNIWKKNDYVSSDPNPLPSL
jgi:parallel beta-helix repeat protein